MIGAFVAQGLLYATLNLFPTEDYFTGFLPSLHCISSNLPFSTILYRVAPDLNFPYFFEWKRGDGVSSPLVFPIDCPLKTHSFRFYLPLLALL